MPRQKGTPNTPQPIIDEIVEKHRSGISIKTLSGEYGKPFKTVKNMCTRENNKLRKINIPKQHGRKPAKTLQEYNYENKRLRMENELLRDFLSLIERK